MTSKDEKIAYLRAQIEQKKSERNRICKQLKKLRQKLNQAEREEAGENGLAGAGTDHCRRDMPEI
ncbi:MAG: hypothetical protein J6A19_05035 [Oscillospiraceae bacterium]|nr:hypothetical protein [Oscillospiraceae bacterium]